MATDDIDAQPPAMHAAFAVDAGFALPLAVALASLARHHRPGELAVTVLHDGLSADTIARVEHGAGGRLDLTWRHVDARAVAGAHFSTFLTRASLFRLLLPRILPESLDRVVYLDCDVVATRSLRPLWDLDLGDRLLAAVRDAGSPFAAGPLGTDWRALGMAADAPYFNTGMLVVPLARWRAHDVSERAVELLRRCSPRWGDQDGLNATLDGRWLELPRRWNLQTPDVTGDGLAWALWREDVEDALGDPAIVHYTDRDKPWHAGCAHPLRGRWLDTLDATAWSGWQPKPTARPLRRRAAARARVAWRAVRPGGHGAAS